MGRYSQLLKNRNKQIIIDPETSEFTSNQQRHKPKSIIQNTNLEIVETLIRPRKDKLIDSIGSIYNFQLNELTNQIEIDGVPIHGNFLNTLYPIVLL